MQISKKVNNLEPEKAYAVLDKANKLISEGKTIIHFEIGQPDFPTPKSIVDKAIKSLKKGQTKYTPPLGVYSLREKISRDIFKSHKVKVNPTQVAITPSGKNAIFTAMATILESGDEVIYPDPGFPSYGILTNFFGAIRKPVPLLEENDFSFDIKALKKNFTKKTKLIILNSPSNPTGGIIPKKDLDEIASLVEGTNTWIMTDEIYTKIVYDNLKCPSIYSYKELNKQTILVDSYSKSYSMTGWRLGYLIAPDEFMQKIDYLLTHTIGCTTTFNQYAILGGEYFAKKDLKKMVKEFERRRNFVVTELNKIFGVKCKTPQGAFYVFPNIKEFGMRSEELSNYLLNTAGVALLDGSAFGVNGEGYLRISYATSMDNLKKGIARMKLALDDL
jgi:aspartate/methionine/tyrosine aminotransferase